MSQLSTASRVLARKVLPNRDWAPIEAWDDERYDRAFRRMRTQPDELEAQRKAAEHVSGPLFSIVVPLFKTPRDYLTDMAESVLAQTYPCLELVLVNASPELADLAAWVGEIAAKDRRVKVVRLDGNYGITENTNRGVAAATGDFICFMDHDDWLEPDTLFEFVAALATQPDIDLMYCDEDLVEKSQGTWHHRHPLFKPDFSPELLLCKNYAIHLLTVRKDIVDSLPAPGSEFDGAQDYNMTLAASEQARRIHHVPKVLYHFRVNEGSTAADPDAKPYRIQAAAHSIRNHLERTGTQGSVEATDIAGTYAIAFPRECGLPASPVTAHPGAGLYKELNEKARSATGDILVFLDPGCSQGITPDALQQLAGLLAIDGVGVVAPKTLFANRTVKSFGIGVSAEGIVPLHRGYSLDYPGYLGSMRTFQNVSAVGYQGLSVKRSLFEELGGFDEAFTGEIGAVDFCQRAIACGKRIVTTCNVELVTADEAPDLRFTDGPHPDYPPEEIERLFAKHPALRTATDPYRNPNLDLRSPYPVIDYRRLR